MRWTRNFRKMASDEIERFRRERVARTGDAREAENITDQDLLARAGDAREAENIGR